MYPVAAIVSNLVWSVTLLLNGAARYADQEITEIQFTPQRVGDDTSDTFYSAGSVTYFLVPNQMVPRDKDGQVLTSWLCPAVVN